MRVAGLTAAKIDALMSDITLPKNRVSAFVFSSEFESKAKELLRREMVNSGSTISAAALVADIETERKSSSSSSTDDDKKFELLKKVALEIDHEDAEKKLQALHDRTKTSELFYDVLQRADTTKTAKEHIAAMMLEKRDAVVELAKKHNMWDSTTGTIWDNIAPSIELTPLQSALMAWRKAEKLLLPNTNPTPTEFHAAYMEVLRAAQHGLTSTSDLSSPKAKRPGKPLPNAAEIIDPDKNPLLACLQQMVEMERLAAEEDKTFTPKKEHAATLMGTSLPVATTLAQLEAQYRVIEKRLFLEWKALSPQAQLFGMTMDPQKSSITGFVAQAKAAQKAAAAHLEQCKKVKETAGPLADQKALQAAITDAEKKVDACDAALRYAMAVEARIAVSKAPPAPLHSVTAAAEVRNAAAALGAEKGDLPFIAAVAVRMLVDAGTVTGEEVTGAIDAIGGEISPALRAALIAAAEKANNLERAAAAGEAAATATTGTTDAKAKAAGEAAALVMRAHGASPHDQAKAAVTAAKVANATPEVTGQVAAAAMQAAGEDITVMTAAAAFGAGFTATTPNREKEARAAILAVSKDISPAMLAALVAAAKNSVASTERAVAAGAAAATATAGKAEAKAKAAGEAAALVMRARGESADKQAEAAGMAAADAWKATNIAATAKDYAAAVGEAAALAMRTSGQSPYRQAAAAAREVEAAYGSSRGPESTESAAKAAAAAMQAAGEDAAMMVAAAIFATNGADTSLVRNTKDISPAVKAGLIAATAAAPSTGATPTPLTPTQKAGAAAAAAAGGNPEDQAKAAGEAAALVGRLQGQPPYQQMLNAILAATASRPPAAPSPEIVAQVAAAAMQAAGEDTEAMAFAAALGAAYATPSSSPPSAADIDNKKKAASEAILAVSPDTSKAMQAGLVAAVTSGTKFDEKAIEAGLAAADATEGTDEAKAQAAGEAAALVMRACGQSITQQAAAAKAAAIEVLEVLGKKTDEATVASAAAAAAPSAADPEAVDTSALLAAIVRHNSASGDTDAAHSAAALKKITSDFKAKIDTLNESLERLQELAKTTNNPRSMAMVKAMHEIDRQLSEIALMLSHDDSRALLQHALGEDGYKKTVQRLRDIQDKVVRDAELAAQNVRPYDPKRSKDWRDKQGWHRGLGSSASETTAREVASGHQRLRIPDPEKPTADIGGVLTAKGTYTLTINEKDSSGSHVNKPYVVKDDKDNPLEPTRAEVMLAIHELNTERLAKARKGETHHYQIPPATFDKNGRFTVHTHDEETRKAYLAKLLELQNRRYTVGAAATTTAADTAAAGSRSGPAAKKPGVSHLRT